MESEASKAVKAHDFRVGAREKHIQEARAEGASRPTIFNHLLLSKLPAEEKTQKRLGEEAFSIIAAGGETVARTLTIATYHLLANPATLEKLRVELRAFLPDTSSNLSLENAEKLPWLVSTKADTKSSASIVRGCPLMSCFVIHRMRW